ncbi:hypothetical protein ACHAXR_008394 [Thalassiosira sp. AJA248-18]
MIKVKLFLSLLAVASVSAANLRGGDRSYNADNDSTVAELKESGGAFSLSIVNNMEANMPAGKTWDGSSFTRALKEAVADGDLNQASGAYKWSPELRRRLPQRRRDDIFLTPETGTQWVMNQRGKEEDNTLEKETTQEKEDQEGHKKKKKKKKKPTQKI